jgi:hypothetical protein
MSNNKGENLMAKAIFILIGCFALAAMIVEFMGWNKIK